MERFDVAWASRGQGLPAFKHGASEVGLPEFAAWARALPRPFELPAWFPASSRAVQQAAEQRNTPLDAGAPVVTMAAQNGSKDSAGKPAEDHETAEQRQDRRLKSCREAGLAFPDKFSQSGEFVGRLPDGIGKVAEREGVKRQTLSADVKAALTREKKASGSSTE